MGKWKISFKCKKTRDFVVCDQTLEQTALQGWGVHRLQNLTGQGSKYLI